VIAISGAMVASLALPASAAPEAAVEEAAPPVALSPAVAVSVPSAAPAPLVPRTFGNIAFVGVAKPKPQPKPKRVVVKQTVVQRPVVKRAVVKRKVVKRAVVLVSRSITRTPTSATSAPRTRVPVQAPSTSGVLGVAASLRGIYYVYGGTSTGGFDCSGFTQYVFRQRGVRLPRTAEQQRQSVRTVTNPRAGDLVFFGAPAYHVGIYAGNGTMWDSPHSGKAISLRSVWSSTVTYGRP
jgi:cell wall-associated NlpC family hydrolase